MPKSGWFLVPLLLLATPAVGREIYVSNVAGDDSFTGSQPQSLPDGSGPVHSITRALQLANSGDRIVLEKTDEPYSEGISLVGNRHSGYPQRPFAIEGNGAILDGSAPIPPRAWQHYRGMVFRFRPAEAGYQQLFLDDRPAIRVAVSETAGAPPTLEPLQWCWLGGEIFFCAQRDKLPEDYRLSHTQKQTGITLFHVRGVGIVNLTVQGFRVDGVSAYNSASDVYLGGVVCRGNGRAGVSVGGASKAEIDMCLLGNNGEAQLLTFPYSETSVHNSELLRGTGPGWVDCGGRVHLNDRRVEGGAEEVKNAPNPAGL